MFPLQGIEDIYLTVNIPKLDIANTFLDTQTFSSNPVFPLNGIEDIYLTSNIPKLDIANTFLDTQTFDITNANEIHEGGANINTIYVQRATDDDISGYKGFLNGLKVDKRFSIANYVDAYEINYTLVTADSGGYVTAGSDFATLKTITLPSLIAIDGGCWFTVSNRGTGKVKVKCNGTTFSDYADAILDGSSPESLVLDAKTSISVRLDLYGRWQVIAGDCFSKAKKNYSNTFLETQSFDKVIVATSSAVQHFNTNTVTATMTSSNFTITAQTRAFHISFSHATSIANQTFTFTLNVYKSTGVLYTSSSTRTYIVNTTTTQHHMQTFFFILTLPADTYYITNVISATGLLITANDYATTISYPTF